MSIGKGILAVFGRTMLDQAKINLVAWREPFQRNPNGAPSPNGIGSAAGLVVILLVGAAGAAACMMTIDGWAATSASQLPGAIRLGFGDITDFGKSGWFLWPIGVLLLLLAWSPTPRLGRTGEHVVLALAVRLTFLFVAIGAPGLFVTIVKRLIGRARPFVGGSVDPFLYHFFGWSPAYASLPSGHATTSVAAAVAFGATWPRSRPYIWTFALVIVISRVIVDAHFPSDVIAGAAVGSVGALLVRNWFAARRLGLVLTPSGRVEAMPGPSLRRLKTVAVRLAGQ